MTVEEIFNKINIHMMEGLIFHKELAKAYDFLGLYGYSKCHEYHHLEELKNEYELSHYYATHYFRFLSDNYTLSVKVIPDTWYKYSSQSVDNTTRKNAIKELMMKWQNWEQSTKKLYQEMYTELTNLSEVASAIKISKYLQDVDKELCTIQKEILYLEGINYNLEIILPEQATLRNKYKKKLKEG